jgi:hypothetical protein
MPTPIVTQLSGRLTALCTLVLGWLTARLWHPAKRLLVSFIQVFQNVRNLNHLNLLRVRTMSSFNRLRVSLIIVEQLIKAGLSTAKAKVIQIGLQLATTVRQTLQRVTIVLLQKKDRLVELIKLAQSRIKMSKIAQILMVPLFRQVGLRLQEAVKQLRLRATQHTKQNRKRVASTKSAQSATQKITPAQTLTGKQSKALGSKQQERVNQPRQRAQRQNSKGR